LTGRVAGRGIGAARPIRLPARAAAAVDVKAPWELEIEAFAQLPSNDYECALSSDRLTFIPMVFWANPAIIAKFPIMSALAHGEYSGLAAEATSERTFSYSGHVFSTLRRNLSPESLCAMVVGAACPLPVSDTEIMAEYETRSVRRERREAKAAAAAVAEEASSDDDSESD